MGSDPNQVRGRVSGRGRGRVKRVRVKVRVRVRVRVEGAARETCSWKLLVKTCTMYVSKLVRW